MTQLREALESALVENPDDLAAHMAYADHLNEQGDPRGELIQTQLALENEGLSSKERASLKAREKKLLEETREACLGKKLASLLDRRSHGDPRSQVERGWLSRIVNEGTLEANLTTSLVEAPQARLLKELAVGYFPVDEYRTPDDVDPMPILLGSKNLTNLRVLQLGTTEGFADSQSEPRAYNTRWELYNAGDPLWDWIATLPHLEELYLECRTQHTERLFGLSTFGNLRILQVNLSDHYPLDVLARNTGLQKVTHLSFQPLACDRDGAPEPYLHLEHLTALTRSANFPALTHLRFQKSDAGDAGVRALLDSGLLRRLKVLDLAMGTITDAGVELLIEADLGTLEVLDVSANAITAAGLRRLGTALKKELRVRQNYQDVAPEPEWLYWGEME
jgi:uncharacterized protein (TIGR02996 family)